MENSKKNKNITKNQNEGSSDENSGFDPKSLEEQNVNKYDSHPEKKPHQSELISKGEQDRNSYKNQFDDNLDLDENGFPIAKDSSFPSNI